MGLLDGILGNVLGSVLSGGQPRQADNPLGGILGRLGGGNQAQIGSLLAAALSMLQQSGGLSAVLEKLRRSGLAREADSWVSTGPNVGISANDVQQIFGASALGDLAAQLGMPQAQASSAMAEILPELVNQLTPQGGLPEEHEDLISRGLEMLRRGGA